MSSRVSRPCRRFKHTTLLFVIVALVFLAIAVVARQLVEPTAAARRLTGGSPNPPPPLFGPRQSSPIALAPNDHTLINVNPEANSVTIFDVTTDTPNKIGEVPVGQDPSSVAIHPDGTRAYVANSFDGTVSIINLAGAPSVTGTFSVGIEPMALALSPNGTRLYVANSVSDTLMVFDTAPATPALMALVNLSPFEQHREPLASRTTTMAMTWMKRSLSLSSTHSFARARRRLMKDKTINAKAASWQSPRPPMPPLGRR